MTAPDGTAPAGIAAATAAVAAPRVSVILPTYNRAASLRAACESVLSQSFRDLELLVVDDASSEDVASVIREIGDPRIRYIRRERNGGASAARNTGLAAARGELIAFQDSDDLWLPGKLARQVAQLDALPRAVGAVTGAKILYGADRARNYGPGKVAYAPAAGRWLSLEEDQVRRFLTENRISLQNALFRRDCFPEPLWFDPRAKANADWEFTIRLVQHTKVYEDVEPVVFSFISGDSISRSRRKRIQGLLTILRKNRALFRAEPKALSANLLVLGRGLIRIGKPRAGRRFVLRAVALDPYSILGLSRAALGRLLPIWATGR